MQAAPSTRVRATPVCATVVVDVAKPPLLFDPNKLYFDQAQERQSRHRDGCRRGSQSNGTRVKQWTFNATDPAEQFYILDNGNNTWRIAMKDNKNQCVDNPANQVVDSTKLQMWQCMNNDVWQQWVITADASGANTFQLKNVGSNLYLDQPGSSPTSTSRCRSTPRTVPTRRSGSSPRRCERPALVSALAHRFLDWRRLGSAGRKAPCSVQSSPLALELRLCVEGFAFDSGGLVLIERRDQPFDPPGRAVDPSSSSSGSAGFRRIGIVAARMVARRRVPPLTKRVALASSLSECAADRARASLSLILSSWPRNDRMATATTA